MFKVILWLLIIYFTFRILGKYLLPLIIKYYLNRFQQKFYQQHPHINKDRKEGETKVEYVPENGTKKKQNTDVVGEYVDYEEIES